MPALWYLVGLASFGVAIGFFAGLSSTPIVAVLLPLIFGLIGGAGGFYLAQAEISSDQGKVRLRLLGQALAVFSMAVVVATAYAVLVRTGQGVTSLLPAIDTPQAPVKEAFDFRGIAPDRSLALVALRKRLQVLGATSEEQEQVLGTVAHGFSQSDISDELAIGLRSIATAAAKVEVFFSKVSLPADTEEDEGDDSLSLRTLVPLVRMNGQIVLDWAKQMASGRSIPRSVAYERVTLLKEKVDTALSEGETLKWLTDNPDFYRALTDLQIVLTAEQEEIFALTLQPDSAEVTSADKLIEMLGVSETSTADLAPILPNIASHRTTRPGDV
jgi:hypothetical protein